MELDISLYENGCTHCKETLEKFYKLLEELPTLDLDLPAAEILRDAERPTEAVALVFVVDKQRRKWRGYHVDDAVKMRFNEKTKEYERA
jgi:hypothetical protein